MNDAGGADVGEEEFEDLDVVDDADAALHGLSLDTDGDFLSRLPPDSEANDDLGWEEETDLVMYPTIDDSQLEDDNAVLFDSQPDMSQEVNPYAMYSPLDVHHHDEPSGSYHFPRENSIPKIQHQQHAVPTVLHRIDPDHHLPQYTMQWRQNVASTSIVSNMANNFVPHMHNLGSQQDQYGRTEPAQNNFPLPWMSPQFEFGRLHRPHGARDYSSQP